MSDPVSNPSHYTSGPPCRHCGHTIECIDIAQQQNFNRGNILKYWWRSGKKADAVEDLRKARQYIDFEIERLGSN